WLSRARHDGNGKHDVLVQLAGEVAHVVGTGNRFAHVDLLDRHFRFAARHVSRGWAALATEGFGSHLLRDAELFHRLRGNDPAPPIGIAERPGSQHSTLEGFWRSDVGPWRAGLY